jgi:hypothetical protein
MPTGSPPLEMTLRGKEARKNRGKVSMPFTAMCSAAPPLGMTAWEKNKKSRQFRHSIKNRNAAKEKFFARLLPFASGFLKMAGWTCPASSNRCSLPRIGP